jgi:hypothetical protein
VKSTTERKHKTIITSIRSSIPKQEKTHKAQAPHEFLPQKSGCVRTARELMIVVAPFFGFCENASRLHCSTAAVVSSCALLLTVVAITG